ncbi:glycosyltransferase [Clostridiaceae bacterium]|nr:glycosyltransferase [Clostridiaceae bacterium]
MKKPTLYIVIPCYNEESVLPITGPLFSDKLSELEEAELIAEDSRILFVNDGSGDRTWELIRAMAAADPRLIGISQSRNRGHQNSLLAGLMYAKDRCDITISIDCDGQDDLNAMNEMVKAWHDGCEVVYGVRSSRQTDSFFKRFTAEAFYRLLNRMGVEVIFNHADYRLLSSRVLAALERFEEVNIFLRGMIPLVGFCSTSVYYERHERLAGESHYPLAKMAALAINGITSLSIRPIRFITGFGLLVAAMSFVGVVWSVTQVFLGHTVPGWGSTVSILCFFSGIQLLAVGIIGEYVGKIYLETKRRPRYIISETTEDGKTEQL